MYVRRYVTAVIIIACVFFMTLQIQAKNDVQMPGDSVYATEEMKQKFASSYKGEPSNSCFMLDSMTPIYYVDTIKYVNTGVWEMLPAKLERNKEGGVYCKVTGIHSSQPIAFLMKSIRKNLQMGTWQDVYFLHDGEVIESFSNKIGRTPHTTYSNSFADHKVRIEKLLGIENISEKDVRYVFLGGSDIYSSYGEVFYFNNGETEAIISARAYYGLFYDKEYLIGDEIRERLKILQEKRILENKIHSLYGENNIVYSWYQNSDYSNSCSITWDHYNYIIDIPAYLKDGTVSKTLDNVRLVGTFLESKPPKYETETNASETTLPTDNNVDEPKGSDLWIVVTVSAVAAGIVYFSVKSYSSKKKSRSL